MRAFGRARRPEAVEQAADLLATQALATHAPPTSGPALALAPPTVGPAVPARPTVGPALRARPTPVPIAPPTDVQVPHGRPLDTPLRCDFERRFEHDFSQVRVHADNALSHTARTLGSRAFALGPHLAFAPGEYRPHGADGRALLAHELAHVVQVDRLAETPRLFSKKAPSRALFYQKELDRLTSASGRELLALRPFIQFCEAVDHERVSDLPGRLDALEKADVHRYPPMYPSSTTTTALLVRLTLLGQAGPARRFRTWYFRLPDVSLLRRVQSRRFFDDEIWFWEDTLSGLRDRVDPKAPDAALALLDALLGFFTQVRAERAALDPAAVKNDAKRLEGQGGLTDTRFGLESSPKISIARFHARLGRLAFDTFVTAQAPYQVALEGAIADLAGGKGPRRLADAEKRIGAALQPMARGVSGFLAEINETVYETRGEVHTLRQVDSFLTGKAALARSVRLRSYDETTATVFPRPTQELEPERIVLIRRTQIAALRRIYGLETDKATGQPTADARENTAALAALGGNGLRLHNDDDWRAFLSAKFEQHLASNRSPEAALDAVIDLLRIYLKAFTVHTPMNIDDFGDNLLTLSFPRTLTGQLVHDCGVYALRIAYALSRIREHPRLKLRLRFIQLPVHVGLIVTGPGLPVYIVHNDTFTKYEAADVQVLRANWDKTDAQGNARATPAAATPKNDEQFLAELAGMEFVPNTDLPFKVTDVPKVGGKVSAADKATLWRSYQGIARNELFGPPTRDPKDPAYQFHLRYLEVLEAIKQHHNTFVVPFWNGVAHPAWVEARLRLTQARRAIDKANTTDTRKKAEAAFDVERERYLRRTRPGMKVSVLEAFDAVNAAFTPITNLTNAIVLALSARPTIVAPRTGLTSGERLRQTFGAFAHPMWMRAIFEHLQDLLARTITPPPPFAERKDLIDRID